MYRKILRFRSCHHHSRGNVHGHQLLEEQLRRIWQLDLRDLRLVLASLALESVVPQVGNSDEAAEIADVDAVRIRDLKQALTEELSRAVGYLAICKH